MRRTLVLIVCMFAAVGLAFALAYWDGARESAEALEDFGSEQATLAASIASNLQTRLSLMPADAVLRLSPEQLFGGLSRLDRPNESLLFIAEPGKDDLLALDGRRIVSPPLQRALQNGAATVRLSRAEALALGLPERTAIAGLSRIAGGWGVAVVTSALRERDRERRAAMRLLLSVAVAALIVGAFGGLALREQRRELLLSRSLALAEAARAEDARLQRLQKAATMLTMASGVAHEIGTPLGVIVGRAEQLLPRVQGDERGERAVRAILEQAANIDAVVRGFLDLARGGAPSLQEVAPAAVAASAVRLVEHRFLQARVRLTSQVPETLPKLRCEPRLLEHALTNLLLNACDACAPGGHVDLSAAEEDSSIRFTVVDDGPGIEVEDAARATKPFFTTKPHGTGLGLAIASEIAKTHHGWLQIEPSLPGGTRACVNIPLSARDQGALDA
ncbi:MAG TPA: HAMP domain-containing sensor histidine kinase [Myxococcales bacterium]|jgi:signal transduction histidine kinase